jgi:predicted RNA binding protein YcfA (HicA-like mRNA interferase family)
MRKTVRQMIEIILSDGWYFVRQTGSHKQYHHPIKKGVVTIPDHGKSNVLDHFVVNSILNQAGLK